MSNKKKLVILILVFVLLLGGASVLYARLGQQNAPDQLAVQGTESRSPMETTSPTEVPQTQSTQATADTQATEPAKPLAPDFVVYDAQGKEVRLSDYFGKPIVLNFWASWCGPCQMEMPDFNEKYLELEGQVEFLMINMTDGGRETVQSASEFIAGQGYQFPVFFDTAGHAATVYAAYSLPTTYFINGDGYAVARATGAISGDTLQRGIDMILP